MNKGLKITLITLVVVGAGVTAYMLINDNLPATEEQGVEAMKKNPVFSQYIDIEANKKAWTDNYSKNMTKKDHRRYMKSMDGKIYSDKIIIDLLKKTTKVFNGISSDLKAITPQK